MQTPDPGPLRTEGSGSVEREEALGRGQVKEAEAAERGSKKSQGLGL